MSSNTNTSVHDLESESQPDDAVIGRAMAFSLAAILILGSGAAATVFYLTRPEALPPPRKSDLAEVDIRLLPEVRPPKVEFRNVTQSVGVNFLHNNGATGEKLLPETMGGGCAWFDFDSDGDQDLLLVNSKDWPWSPPSQKTQTCLLLRNDEGSFVDVTADSGLDEPIYGMGAAVGDFDNDGNVDVFITAVGENRLLRNLGNGKFQDVTLTAGVAGEKDRWSSSAGWFDFDNDADLDLFVCNYVVWSHQFDVSQNFQLVGGGRAYGRPQNFEGTFPYLYRNEGDGRFTDVSAESGVQIRNRATDVPLAKSLGVTFCDFDSDGAMDIVVANDTVQNLLLRNDGKGNFVDVGTLSGIAFDAMGNARGAMGIDVGMLRNRSATAVAIGNFSNEMSALYITKPGAIQFYDEAVSTGLGPATRLSLTFGLFYFDYDLDGRLDLFCANGHLEEDINRVQPSQHYEQPPQMFWNAGPECDTEFVSVDESLVGAETLEPIVGRGAAYADMDGDGDLDVLVTACGGAARLLRNDQQLGHHYVRIRLVGDGKHCNRDAIGSWVQVDQGGRVQRSQVMPTKSYLSQMELPLTFGLGPSDEKPQVVVMWSDGTVTDLGQVEIDQTHQVAR